MNIRIKYPVQTVPVLHNGEGIDRKALILKSSCGFTLLELMVSFMIIAMMVGILTGALKLGIKTVNSGERRIDSLERLSASVRIIDSQIQSFNPLTYVEDDEEMYYFEGDGSSMRFPSNHSIWGGEKGYVIVSYSVEEDDDGKLHIAASENVMGKESIRETTLLDSLETANFEYFYTEPLEETGDWVDSWDEKAIIPEKIRLSFLRGSDDFSIIIPLRATGKLTTNITRNLRGQVPGL
jgi:type II secretory pathway pseudopilin PulG